MSAKMVNIYGIRAMNADLYFYIGSTKFDIEYRLNQHIDTINRGNNANRHFVHKMKKVGFENVVIELITTATEEHRYDAEFAVIREYAAAGHPLTNVVRAVGTYPASPKIEFEIVKIPQYEFEISLNHLEAILDLVEMEEMPSAGDLASNFETVAYSYGRHAIQSDPHEFLGIIEQLDNEETHTQAASIRQRVLAMLECN